MKKEIMEVDMLTGEIDTGKPKYRNNDNYKLGEFQKDMEVNDGKSETVPDESYTIEEILEKFTRGVLPDIAKNSEYEEIEDFDGYETENPVDITEVEEQLTLVNERISFAKSKSGKAKKSESTTTKEEDESEVEPEANNSQK